MLFFKLIMLKITGSNVRYLFVYSALFWVPFLFFSAIANEVTESAIFPPDIAILNYIHNNFSPSLSNFFLVITNLGNAIGIVIIASFLIALLLKARQQVSASVVLVSVAGAAIANFVIKLFFQRDRPSLWQSIIQEQSFSFPSGHAMASSALYFALVYVAWRTRWRWAAVFGGGILVILIGFSRLYFGVHYPSDVLAGWLVSFIWVCIVVTVLTRTNITAYFKNLFS